MKREDILDNQTTGANYSDCEATTGLSNRATLLDQWAANQNRIQSHQAAQGLDALQITWLGGHLGAVED